MRSRSFSRYSDPELLRRFASLVRRDRVNTAALLACLAEVDARKLYLPAGCPSMYTFCVDQFGFSEDAAYKRIQAARVARGFPGLLEALAAGRLHLTGVCLLAPYLSPGNADQLIAASAHKTKRQIEELLAKRFPRTESFAMVQPLPPPRTMELLAEVAAGQGPGRPSVTPRELAPAQVGTRSRMAPIAEERSLVQFVVGGNTQSKVRYAEELLGHQVQFGDLAQMFDLAMDALIEKLVKRKFGTVRKPRPAGRNGAEPSGPNTRLRPRSANARYIPRHIKRAVWARDGARCTFVSESGRRCTARTPLEFDHVTEVARGGLATVEGIRLRCRAHNQYGAECTFGAEFMRRKREAAKRAREVRRQEAARDADQARQETEVRRESETRARAAAEEVITPLRLLGFRADEARRAAAECESIPDATLEERVRRALSYLAPRTKTLSSEHARPCPM